MSLWQVILNDCLFWAINRLKCNCQRDMWLVLCSWQIFGFMLYCWCIHGVRKKQTSVAQFRIASSSLAFDILDSICPSFASALWYDSSQAAWGQVPVVQSHLQWCKKVCMWPETIITASASLAPHPCILIFLWAEKTIRYCYLDIHKFSRFVRGRYKCRCMLLQLVNQYSAPTFQLILLNMNQDTVFFYLGPNT